MPLRVCPLGSEPRRRPPPSPIRSPSLARMQPQRQAHAGSRRRGDAAAPRQQQQRRSASRAICGPTSCPRCARARCGVLLFRCSVPYASLSVRISLFRVSLFRCSVPKPRYRYVFRYSVPLLGFRTLTACRYPYQSRYSVPLRRCRCRCRSASCWSAPFTFGTRALHVRIRPLIPCSAPLRVGYSRVRPRPPSARRASVRRRCPP